MNFYSDVNVLIFNDLQTIAKINENFSCVTTQDEGNSGHMKTTLLLTEVNHPEFNAIAEEFLVIFFKPDSETTQADYRRSAFLRSEMMRLGLSQQGITRLANKAKN